MGRPAETADAAGAGSRFCPVSSGLVEYHKAQQVVIWPFPFPYVPGLRLGFGAFVIAGSGVLGLVRGT